MVVTPGGMKLQRRWVDDTLPGPHEFRGGAARGAPGVGRLGRPVTGFSAKARRQMRWVWNALPWDEVPRLTMLTLTYPGDWRAVCPDGETLKRQLRAFRHRWTRRWSGPVGTWALEFQPRPMRPEPQRHAPHFHLFVGLPEEAVEERDKSDGRLMWDWARQAWWEVVGSGDIAHRWWGVHYRPCFYGRYGGGRENGKRVGDYLWRESGKLAQKEAPDGFDGVKWWAVWGMRPREAEQQISRDEFVAMRRPTVRLRDGITGAKVRRPSRMDGLSVTNIDGVDVGVRLLRWSENSLEDAASEDRPVPSDRAIARAERRAAQRRERAARQGRGRTRRVDRGEIGRAGRAGSRSLSATKGWVVQQARKASSRRDCWRRSVGLWPASQHGSPTSHGSLALTLTKYLWRFGTPASATWRPPTTVSKHVTCRRPEARLAWMRREPRSGWRTGKSAAG